MGLACGFTQQSKFSLWEQASKAMSVIGATQLEYKLVELRYS